MKRQRINDSNGYIVLITVLVLGVIVSTIAAYLLLAGSSASITSLAVESGIESKAAAIGCADLALDAIEAAPTLTTPSNGSSTLNATTGEACTYAISGTTPSYTILSTGTVSMNGNIYYYHMTIVTSQTTPSVKVLSWQDTP
jgi:uncharacterized membrane protein